MTRIGYAVMIALMGVSLIALIVCSVRQRKDGLPRAARGPRNDAKGKLPTVSGEPVFFRTAEMRFVNCKASMETGIEQMEERGFDPRDMQHRAAAEAYYKKELAYILADQLLAAGAIRFEQSENTIRAKLRAVIEGGARDA